MAPHDAARSSPSRLPSTSPHPPVGLASGNSTRRISGAGTGGIMGPPRGKSPARGMGTASTAAAAAAGSSGVGTQSPQPPLADGGGGSGGGTVGDLPRLLPRVSSNGARKSESGSEAAPGSRATAGAYLRRSSTVGMSHRELGAPAAAAAGRTATSNHGGVGGMPGVGGTPEGGAFLVKRDRDTLQHEKVMLLVNKRRLEALLRGVLDQQHPQHPQQQQQQQQQQPLLEQAEGGGVSHSLPAPVQRASSLRSSGNGAFMLGLATGPGSASVGLTGGNLRSQILKALDDSSGLDAQITPSGAVGGALSGGAAAAGTDGNVDARVQELSARLAQLQTEHDIAIARFEGELRYRNTQASAATSQLLRQLSELDAQVDVLRRALAASEGRVADLTGQNTDLRHSNQDLAAALRDKSTALEEATSLMGPDTAALSAAQDVLRSQLREANLALASRERRMHELERQAAVRSKALEEAQCAITELRALSGIAAVGGGGGGGGVTGGGASISGFGGGGDVLAAAAALGLTRDEACGVYGGAGPGGASGVRAGSGTAGWQHPVLPPRRDSRSPAGAESPAGSAGAGAGTAIGGACRSANGPPPLVLVTSFLKKA